MKKYDIFISYRRSGGQDLARMLKESLTAKGYNTFLDFDGLKDGYFDEKIMRAIDEAPVFILILSKGSMARCVDENDWVRKEIEYALSKGKQIIPVDPNHEFDGFPEDMSAELKDKVGQHQFSLLDTTQLYRESLNKIVRERIAPVMAAAQKKRKRPIWYTILAIVGLFAALLIFSTLYSALNVSQGDTMYEQAMEKIDADQIYDGLELLYQAGTKYDHFESLSYLGDLGYRISYDKSYTVGNELQLTIYGWFMQHHKMGLIARFHNNSSSPIMPDLYDNLTCILPTTVRTFAIYDLMHDYKDVLHTTIYPGESSKSFALIIPRVPAECQSIDLCVDTLASMSIEDLELTNYRQFGLVIDEVVATDDETVLTCSFTTAYPLSGWYSWEPTTYIRPAGRDEQLAVSMAENCSFSPEKTDIRFGETATFKLYFPSLPTGVSEFDLIEAEGSSFNKSSVFVTRDLRTTASGTYDDLFWHQQSYKWSMRR